MSWKPMYVWICERLRLRDKWQTRCLLTKDGRRCQAVPLPPCSRQGHWYWLGTKPGPTDCESFHGLYCGLKVPPPLKVGRFYTQACMPIYVSILRIPPDDMSLESDGGMTYIDKGKPKKSEKSLSQCLFVHKSHMDWPRREPGLPRWEAAD
jgi:hypothetical protein